MKSPRLPRPKFEREIEIEGSDLVEYVQYDPNNQILDATFKTGERYRYRQVGTWDFIRLVTSKSAGKAFNQYIKRSIWTHAARKATKLPT